MLPENYYVHTTTKEQGAEICLFCRENDFNKNYQNGNAIFYYGVGKNLYGGGLVLSTTIRDSGYPIFEYNEWKKLIQNKKEKDMSEKKIIGYKAPKDLFAGNVKKGTIYKTESGGSVYYPEHLAESSDSSFNFPYEIVEDWEPVYEESYKVGDNIIWVEDYDERGKSWFVKGDVAQITHVSDNFVQMYSPKEKGIGGFSIDNENFRIATPEEIIEAKLPKEGDFIYITNTDGNLSGTQLNTIYKVSSIKKESSNWNTELVDSNGATARYRVHADDDRYSYIKMWRKATPEEIENFSKIEFLGYTLEINEEYAKFGCQHFTKQQVESLLNFTERTAFNAEVRINDTVVKPEFLSKILAKMADYENS